MDPQADCQIPILNTGAYVIGVNRLREFWRSPTRLPRLIHVGESDEAACATNVHPNPPVVSPSPAIGSSAQFGIVSQNRPDRRPIAFGPVYYTRLVKKHERLRYVEGIPTSAQNEGEGERERESE